MMDMRFAGAVVVLLACAALLQTVQVVRRWRIGAAAAVDWRAGLIALPKRYLVDVHHVVARDPFAARMHALAAGGLLAGSALLCLSLLPGLAASRTLATLAALAFAAMLAGGLMVRSRRHPAPPPRLSGGQFQRLPAQLAGCAAAGLLVSLSAATHARFPGAIGVVLLAVCGALLIRQTVAGPLRHAIAGAIHLAAHPRPARFAGALADAGVVAASAAQAAAGFPSALLPLDLDAAHLGIETAADFTWNCLAGFDSCIQCGRCEQACPAFAAGAPLNPKKLIQDLVSCATGEDGSAYSGSPHPGLAGRTAVTGPHRPIVGEHALVAPETLWSCTTCRACVEECPMMIEHVDAVIGLRRFQVLESGAVPPKAAAALSNLRYADDPAARPPSARLDFAAGLDIPVAQPGEPVDVLLWLGEGAYDLRYARTLRALAKLLRLAAVDFAVLGEAEADCGDLARRLGDEATFAARAQANIATLQRYRFTRILTADPHAYHTLKNEYPDFGGIFAVLHHSEYLQQLLETGRLSPTRALTRPVAFHDPCYLARYNGIVDAPRDILRRTGAPLLEMPRAGKRALCCGGGGGAPLTDIAAERRVGDIRMAQAQETGAALLAVACPGCTAMLEAVPGPRPEVQDIAELLLDCHEPAP